METDSSGSPILESGSNVASGGRRYFIIDGFKERLVLNLTSNSGVVSVPQDVVIEYHSEEGVNEEVEGDQRWLLAQRRGA